MGLVVIRGIRLRGEQLVICIYIRHTIDIPEFTVKITTTKKIFSLPTFMANRLEEISNHTGYSQTNLVTQALSSYMKRFEAGGSIEEWMERSGKACEYH